MQWAPQPPGMVLVWSVSSPLRLFLPVFITTVADTSSPFLSFVGASVFAVAVLGMPPKSEREKTPVGAGVKRSRSRSPPATPPTKMTKPTGRSNTPSPSRSLEAKATTVEPSMPPAAAPTTPTAVAAVEPLALPKDDAKKTENSIWSQVEPFQRRTEAKDFEPEHMFKLITWNVAGLRGLLRKDARAIQQLLEAEQPDALCLQETKLNPEDPQNTTLGEVPGYRFVDHACRAKKGYSGTRTYIKDTVAAEWKTTTVKGFNTLKSAQNVGRSDGDDEGRVLTTYFGTGGKDSNEFALALVNTYIPNSGMTLERLPYRYQTFDVKVRQHLCALSASCRPFTRGGANDASVGTSPLTGFIWTGDLNVAERDYDRYFAGTYKAMQKCSGFTPEERVSFRETLRLTGAVDTFRALYPRAAPVYTFWSARINGRARGLGWRLDYFVVSAALASRVVDCFTMPHVMGSDHCPVQMWLRK
ncbi:apurinic/apyrimidinic endonuclease [Trypanosoma grayi]|uniref:apurinic/apyrimidinic endonuclease n=1 Tax=Trypanosoma grayi TaxID=71804 RepID=UPI0004F43D43|nr:apurinic/apyrimidinic endonuclease [Trypanosoma grayi]KEG12697.1 apurinic/apyrimidinic endonuclease [Trypanosoma grayi]